MKKIVTVFVGLGLVLSSCDYLQGYIKGSSASAEDSLQAKDSYMAARDLSITAQNAYSDIFIDSTSVENFIQRQGVAEPDARKMRSFYNGRNYQAAWLSSAGFTEQGRSLWNNVDSAETSGKDSALIVKETRVLIDSLMEEDSLRIAASDSVFVQTELTLTRAFINNAKDWNVPEQSMHAFYIPAKKVNAMQLADSILNKQLDSSFEQTNKLYAALKGELQRYYTLAKDSTWQAIPAVSGQLKKGASAPAVALIKKRLAATGDWVSADTSHLYSDSLHQAIVAYQKRHGLDSNGVVSDTMITLLNVRPQDRIEQLLVNMNRALWSPTIDSGRRAVVNVPSFMLQVFDADSLQFEMPVVVGKEGTNTLMLNGKINEVVFNPYWNIPASIVETEIMPAMKADPNYLKKHNMEVVNQGDSIPQIRQLPGANNSLGKVKFLFPNPYDIYLHDSPAKNLFEQDKRAFSHGCIRVADATTFAQYLLRNESGWNAEKITQAMNSGKEQRVALSNSLPVYINYYTVWVDEKGKVHYRDDVYGHDAKTRSMMFTQSGV